MTVTVYCNGFWSGFMDRTNPVHIDFFVNLLKKVYNDSDIQIGTLDSADVLIEDSVETANDSD